MLSGASAVQIVAIDARHALAVAVAPELLRFQVVGTRLSVVVEHKGAAGPHDAGGGAVDVQHQQLEHVVAVFTLTQGVVFVLDVGGACPAHQTIDFAGIQVGVGWQRTLQRSPGDGGGGVAVFVGIQLRHGAAAYSALLVQPYLDGLDMDALGAHVADQAATLGGQAHHLIDDHLGAPLATEAGVEQLSVEDPDRQSAEAGHELQKGTVAGDPFHGRGPCRLGEGEIESANSALCGVGSIVQ